MALLRTSAPQLAHWATLLSAVLPGGMRAVASVYLITVAGLGPFAVGSYNYASTFLGIIVTYYAGRGRLDRFDPVSVFALTSVLSVLSLLCTLAAGLSVFWLVPAALISAVGQIGGPSLYMYDERYGPADGGKDAGLYRTRMLFSIAWIIGPPLSFLIFWASGYPLVVCAMGLMYAGASLAMLLARSRRAPNPVTIAKPAAKPIVGEASPLGFWPIFTVMVATTCANVLHSIDMPLYLIQTLQVPSFWPGFLMSTAAGIEVVVIALLPRLTKATSDETIMWVGLGAGVVYFGLLNFMTAPGVLLVAQLLYGSHFAATTVVCLPLLRRATSGGVGSLASQFTNASKIGALLAAVVFALAGGTLGYHAILVVICPALLLLALGFGVLRWLGLQRGRKAAGV
ncbi:MAG: hypothetical protein ABIQ30_00440 [Devosia sp.]